MRIHKMNTQEALTIDDFIKMQDFTVSEKAIQPTITWPAGHGILVGNGFKFLAFKKMEVKEGVQLSIVGDGELHFTVKEAVEAEQVCQAQEPVAYFDHLSGLQILGNIPEEGAYFYTHPAQSWQGNKELKGLSMTEIYNIADKHGMVFHTYWEQYGLAIEQALKEKNT